MKQRRGYFGKPSNYGKLIVLLISAAVTALLFSADAPAGVARIGVNNSFNLGMGPLTLWVKTLGGAAVFIGGVIFGFTNGGLIVNKKEKLHKGDQE